METKMQKNRKKKFLFVCLFVLFVKKKKIENVLTNFFAFLISKASLEVPESMVQKSSLKNFVCIFA